jgi:hypothetical protein
MKVTRHNYEEFFILYMDNELGLEDRRQVELFVEVNPDLRQELDLLLQTKLVPDHDLVLQDKIQLFKKGSADTINATNYKEWLHLYIDQELTASQKLMAGDLIASHPEIQQELQLLQKAKLLPDPTVLFPNKEVLYRSEEKVRVISLQWKRIAVAAALLFAIGTAIFVASNDNGPVENGIAGNSAKDSTPAPVDDQPAILSKTVDKNDTDRSPSLLNEPEISSAASEDGSKEKKQSIHAEKALLKEKMAQPDEARPVMDETPKTALLTKESNNLPSPSQNPNVVNPSITANNATAFQQPSNAANETDLNKNNGHTTVTPGTDRPLDNTIAAVSRESNEPLETEPTGKKSKLRGFFRKITRNFEKRTNIKATDDDDHLLLAGFSVKL